METLLPIIDEVNAPFWQGCREGVLRIQQCTATGRFIFPPRSLSPFAPRTKPRWVEVAGRGKIWSCIEPHPPLMLNFNDLVPYNAIIVELDEDPTIRLAGNLVAESGGAINAIRYDEIVIGTAVKVVFEKINAEVTLPRWIYSAG